MVLEVAEMQPFYFARKAEIMAINSELTPYICDPISDII